MNGENQPLVIDEPVGLKNNRLKFKMIGKLPIILKGIHRIHLNLMKNKRRISTCNWLNLEILGF